MRQAGIREFRDHATRYLAGDDVVVVQRHGRTVGFFVPVRVKRDEEARKSIERLGAAVDRLLEESGLDEDELVRAFTGPIE